MGTSSEEKVDLSKPESFITHLKPSSIPHDKILEKLKQEIEQIDFQEKAFPKVTRLRKKKAQLDFDDPDDRKQLNEVTKELEKLKPKNDHYLILSIENLKETAEINDWSLCKNLSFTYLYNGCYWKVIDDQELKQFIGECAEIQGVPWEKARVHYFRDQLLKQFFATEYLPAPKADDQIKINLQNGTFEINTDGTSKLRDFRQEDFITYQLPFSYKPDATAPKFTKFLNRVLPDQERQNILFEYLGYIFVKNSFLKLEKVLCLYGSGANGKSVIFDIITAMLGPENVSTYTMQSLTNEDGYYRAGIANKLVNYASEINTKLESSIFKQLVSGEPVQARRPYGQAMTLYEYARLIFNANELPRDVEQNNAFFRRFLILPFDVTIRPDEQDPKLANKIIKDELPGIFNMILEGLSRLLEQGAFSHCQASEEALNKYKVESDSVRLFLQENEYISDDKNYMLIKDLYKEYTNYCHEDGCRPVNKQNFRRRLENAGIITEKKRDGNVAYVKSNKDTIENIF